MCFLTHKIIDGVGYLCIPNFVDSEQVNALKAQAKKLIDEFDMKEIAIFTTGKKQEVSDRECKQTNTD
jgi:hypothetical protein